MKLITNVKYKCPNCKSELITDYDTSNERRGLYCPIEGRLLEPVLSIPNDSLELIRKRAKKLDDLTVAWLEDTIDKIESELDRREYRLRIEGKKLEKKHNNLWQE